MNEPDRVEIEQLQQRVEALHRRVSQNVLVQLEQLQRQQEAQQQEFKLQHDRLAARIQQLEALAGRSGATPGVASPGPLSPATPRSSARSMPALRPSPPGPPPVLPPVLPAQAPAAALAGAKIVPKLVSRPLAPAALPPPPPPSPAATEPASFELRVGTYWLVRIGIVMLLTGLVFFGNFAYQNFIGKLGAGGKVTLLYLAGGLLLGVGGWLQRRRVNDALRNYGQVVFAGGLAAVYFTTYAAHYVAPLKIISSALVDGVLLFGWAAAIVALADWKKSEVLALFAVCLAYYASIVSGVKTFTLFSNLGLTLAAVVFLVRNRWARVSFISLAATYLGYGFWRFYHGNTWLWEGALASGDQWTGNGFLLGYWVLFTAAVFLSRHAAFAASRRATFLTFNNGAYYAFAVLTSNHAIPAWLFTSGFGIALTGLAFLAHRRLADEPIVKNAYLSQGLVCLTLGLILKFTGTQLGLILAAESVVLLILGGQRQNRILQTGAYLAAGLAACWGVAGVWDAHPAEGSGVWLGTAIGALLVFDAVWLRRQTAPGAPEVVCPKRSYFTLLGLGVWLLTTRHFVAPEFFGAALAVEAMALTASYYALRVREIAVFGQGYLMLAQVSWLGNALELADPSRALPWWNPVLMIVVTLALSHWWQRQRAFVTDVRARQILQGLYSLAVVGVLEGWLRVKFGAPAWLAITSLLAVAITVYGLVTRATILAAVGQLFLIASAVQFVEQLVPASPGYAPPFWLLGLAPVATCLVVPALAAHWLAQRREPDAAAGPVIEAVGLAYRLVAVLMSLLWIRAYIPSREWCWVLAMLGGLVFAWGEWRRARSALGFSAIYTVVGLGWFWTNASSSPQTVYGPNLLVVLLLLGQQQMARRLGAAIELRPEWHGAMILAGGASLWRFVSQWVLQNASGFYLTASWAALALVIFAVGFALRERTYRWLGLAVLAGALGRVVIFDVWTLETVYRILSFMALGVVLLLLGFVYNKFQEKIREWL